MGIDQIITLALGLAGWVFAIVQFVTNRKWQKKDRIKEQRYLAYKAFLEKLDIINSSMQTDPASSVFALTFDFVEDIRKGSSTNPSQTVADYGKRILEHTKKSVDPLLVVTNEINSLKLIASPILLKKLEELKLLCHDLYSEIMLCLSKISGPELEEFQQLKTVGQQERWKRFASLNDEIFKLMRKEIGVEN